MSTTGNIESSQRDIVVGGEKNKLVIQPVGEAVLMYLEDHFSDLLTMTIRNKWRMISRIFQMGA